MFMTIYPAFSHDVEASRKLLEQFPPVVRAMFGLSLSAFFTFLGFYAYAFTYITLVGAIQAMNLGLSLLSKEDSSKTTDFLLSKPVTRTKIFFAKLAASLTMLTITIIIFTVMTFIFAKLFGAGDFDLKKYLVLNLIFFVIQLWFLALGIIVSQLLHKIRSVVSISLGFVFSFFVVGLVGAVIGVDKVRYLTPFKYFDYLKYVASGKYDLKYMVLAAVAIIIAIVTGYLIYNRRDARSVA
jgi:ABC-2 type transport system permease protein